MRVLYGKTFGIGNAVMAVPAIKAISTIAEVDVLVGSSPDDAGAFSVMESLQGKSIRMLWINNVPKTEHYDVAVMAIPFDGRWQNGIHFSADRVLDGRPRPDPATFGFSSWKKHESLYQMESAYELGYSGKVPSSSFKQSEQIVSRDRVYLGVGFKRDKEDFWRKKHWGNERYARFIDAVAALDPKIFFVATGDEKDLVECINPINQMTKYRRLTYRSTFGFHSSYSVVGSCGAYVGNDTGMMHVAASYGLPVFAMFGCDAQLKNYPLCDEFKISRFDGDCGEEPEHLASEFVSWYRGIK